MIMKSIFKASHLAALVATCVFLTASAQAQSWITNGLVAYYPFNGNANDEAGNGNDGVVSNAEFKTDRFGTVRAAMLISAVNGGVTSITKMPITGNMDRTISFWCKFSRPATNSGYGQAAVEIGNYESFNGDFLFSQDMKGPAIYFHGGSTPTFFYSGTLPYYSQWRHLVFSYHFNLDSSSCYVNGAAVVMAGVALGGEPLNTESTALKIFGISGDYIDDVRIYNRALSSNEVAQLYAIESANPDTYVLAIKAATQIQQASTTNLSGLITTPVPLKSTFTTATILSSLAQDEHAAGNYPSSTFPAGALLVVRGDSVIVTDSATNELVDVSDILTAQSDDNSVFSGKQNNATGLAAPMLSEIQYQKLVYDDSAITNGAHLSFTLGGLATVVTKDTVNAIAGTYSETVTSTVKSGVGTGNYQGTPFILSGSFTATCKKNATVP
jgi:hypothetical protein